MGKWTELAPGSANGGPLPTDPKLRHMWKTFWGEDYSDREVEPRECSPGAWRIEVSPTCRRMRTFSFMSSRSGIAAQPAANVWNC